eukprot:scaffold95757_cov67-Phaeocystis_antarctica.AAC.6
MPSPSGGSTESITGAGGHYSNGDALGGEEGRPGPLGRLEGPPVRASGGSQGQARPACAPAAVRTLEWGVEAVHVIGARAAVAEEEIAAAATYVAEVVVRVHRFFLRRGWGHLLRRAGATPA